MVKQTNGVDKQHGIRSLMIGKVANRRDDKGETYFLSLSTYLDREDSWKTWTKAGTDGNRGRCIALHMAFPHVILDRGCQAPRHQPAEMLAASTWLQNTGQ